MIKAVTFDLWDTIFIDDSDEPKRKARGLASKPETRRKLIFNYLNHNNAISEETVKKAYDTVDAAFRHVWYQQNITWTVEERLSVLFKGLGHDISDSDLSSLVVAHEEMELDIQPDIIEGADELLSELSKTFKLAVISDAIFSPGRVLRQILEKNGLLNYFDAFVFSDEIGCSKPNPIVFNSVAESVQVKTSEIIHIGDREEKDVAGPHAVGGKAVLTTVIKDRGSKDSKAEIICSDYKSLPDQIHKLLN